jgi:hypothetical protein
MKGDREENEPDEYRGKRIPDEGATAHERALKGATIDEMSFDGKL